MNILMVCHDLPNPSNPLTFRVYHAVKYLSKKYGHKITLVAFRRLAEKGRYVYADMGEFCEVIPVDIPENVNSFTSKLIYAMKNTLSPRNLFSGNVSVLNIFYSPKMHDILDNLLKSRTFDIIFLDFTYMIPYVVNSKIPKVIEVLADGRWFLEDYKKTRWLSKDFPLKLRYLMKYIRMSSYEKNYQKFDACIIDGAYEAELLKSAFPDLNITAIPYGIDTEYFRHDTSSREDYPSIAFMGNMKTKASLLAVRWFYNEIYPLIKRKMPNVKFYIAGKDPPEEISNLGADKSIIVTGYVEDIRPYYNYASVIAVPISIPGARTRILEAMSMGKAIVMTSTAKWIDITPEGTVLVANSPSEFAEQVIRVLSDKGLRISMGEKARDFVEKEYSWEIASEKFHKLLVSTVT